MLCSTFYYFARALYTLTNLCRAVILISDLANDSGILQSDNVECYCQDSEAVPGVGCQPGVLPLYEHQQCLDRGQWRQLGEWSQRRAAEWQHLLPPGALRLCADPAQAQPSRAASGVQRHHLRPGRVQQADMSALFDKGQIEECIVQVAS